MVALLAVAGAATWYFINDANRLGLPATRTSSSGGTTVGSEVEASSQPATTALSSQPARSSATGTQRPIDAQASGSLDDHTEYASTPGTTTLPPELRQEDVEIDPQTGMMTVKRLPSEAPPMQQPTEIVGPRELPPGDVEIDPQTGQMTLKRYQQ
jgi:hypothetical protein